MNTSAMASCLFFLLAGCVEQPPNEGGEASTATPIPAAPVPCPRDPFSATPFPEALISISFDDGWEGQSRLALPALDSVGMSATFYLTSGFLGNTSDGFMTTEDARKIAIHGHEIGNHTVTHPNLARLDTLAINRELEGCQDALVSGLGVPDVVSFATPSGDSNGKVVSVSKTIFQSQRGVTRGQNFVETDPYDLHSNAMNSQLQGFVGFDGDHIDHVQNLIRDSVGNKSWLILHFHQITDGPPQKHIDYPVSDFSKVLEMIRASGARVVTVREGGEIQRALRAQQCAATLD